MAYSDTFVKALDHSMIYEVGGFWNISNPAVASGSIATPADRKAVGYVNDPVDAGGETKFGVAKNANPTVNIKTLTWAQAEQIYFNKYWLVGYNDKLPAALAQIHLDGCINHGPSRACKFLQEAVGATPDGVIGPKTIAAINAAKLGEVIQAVARIRRNFYEAIVRNNPPQVKFLNGWLRRINEVEHFALGCL